MTNSKNYEKTNNLIEEEQKNKHEKLEVLAKVLRVVSVPPIIALVLVLLLFFFKQGSYNVLHLFMTILFLSVLPMLVYPITLIIPSIRKKGRDFQRNLAIIFSGVSYLCAVIFALCTKSGSVEIIVDLTYLFSVVFMLIFNYVFKIKASGHTTALSGPIFMLSVQISWFCLLAYVLLVPMFWSSLKLHRHSIAQLTIGVAIPIISVLLAILIM